MKAIISQVDLAAGWVKRPPFGLSPWWNRRPPILWHIMKTYSHYGINDFIICLGYKGYMIKEFFANYFLHASDVTIDLQNNKWRCIAPSGSPGVSPSIDTGAATMTGGRLKRVLAYVEKMKLLLHLRRRTGRHNIDDLLHFHRMPQHPCHPDRDTIRGKLRRFRYQRQRRTSLAFREAPGEGRWINGGYLSSHPKSASTSRTTQHPWEREPMETLAREGQVRIQHDGFWQPMDTLHDKNLLEGLWNNVRAPWKVW